MCYVGSVLSTSFTFIPNGGQTPDLPKSVLTEKKTTVDQIRMVLQKGYVLYGITATSELVYRFLRRVDQKRCNLIYRWL